MNDFIIAAGADHVLTITFNRYSKRNAISQEMLADIRAAIDDPANRDIHAVILRGAGGFFSAGADLDALTGSSADRSFDEELTRVTGIIRNMPAVSVAVVEGGCIGAALDLACACNLRIGTGGAFFAIPAVELGLLYNPRAVARIHAVLPGSALRRLFLLGERLSADVASAMGLLDQIVADGEIDATIEKLAHRLVSSPLAAKATGGVLASLADGSFDPDYWHDEYVKIMNSPERWEALSMRKKQSAPN